MTRYFISTIIIILLFTSKAFALWHEKTFPVMGTQAKVQFWLAAEHNNNISSNQLIHAVEIEMERINQSMSPYISTSELSKVNKLAGLNPVKVSDELFALLEESQRIAKLSQGAFDITFASIGYRYQYREKIKPTRKEISQNLGNINYRGIVLNTKNKTVFFKRQGIKIDLGGIAKGYAVKNCLSILKGYGIKHGLVSAGGDTGLLGDKRGQSWMVGIKHPRADSTNVVHLPLENEAISTSGDYERYFIENGQRYHHIINPKTGTSAKEMVSVSVIGKDPTFVDALSTTLFVLGLQPSLLLINSLEGYEAILIDNKHTLHFSEGLTQ